MAKSGLLTGGLVIHLLIGSLIWSGTLYVGEYLPLKQLAADNDEGLDPFIIILSVVEYIRLPYISPNMVPDIWLSFVKAKQCLYLFFVPELHKVGRCYTVHCKRLCCAKIKITSWIIFDNLDVFHPYCS